MKIIFRPIILLTLLFVTSCVVIEQRKCSEQPVRCEVLTVRPTASLKSYVYMATVQAEAHISLSLPYGGMITEVCVRPNTAVAKDAVLLRLDDTNARQALATANASLKQAQDALQRTRPMHEKGLITDIQMVELQTKYDQAQAACTAAERQVSQSVLTAPLSGLVTFDALHAGQHIAPEVPVMTLLDMSGFTVLIHVPETEIASLHLGEEASLDVPALQLEGLRVQISRLGVQANSLTHTYPVEAYIGNPPAGLLPGMVGSLTLRQPESGVIVIPQRCITMLPDGPAVWVADPNGCAERRTVQLGKYQADGVQVTGGLNDGDQVIVAGYQKLYPGAKIVY